MTDKAPRPQPQKIKITFRQIVELIVPYIKSRLLEQIKSVWIIIFYLILFQTLILGIPIADASIIAIGLVLVIVGLTLFMEGLLIGLMPLGETIGLKLPQKSKKPVILLFALILGMGVTFAEPAIGILKAAGYAVKPWDAPLLFLLLNKYSSYLVLAVALGVGLAVVAGMLRFLYDWSLKPYIYVLVTTLLAVSLWGLFEPNVRYLTGLAWDCGGVTTGPVTVPLVIALGIGICRIVGNASSGSAGFGVVTLASLFPITMVLFLGMPLLPKAPDPMDQESFFSAEHRSKVQNLFGSKEEMIGYALKHANEQSQLTLFEGDREKMSEFIANCMANDKLRREVFGPEEDALQRWAALSGTAEQRLVVFGSDEAVRQAAAQYFGASAGPPLNWLEVAGRNSQAALQAILPLCIFLMLVLFWVLRERLPRTDEIVLGIVLALAGMSFFTVGIELGLAKLGAQTGSKLPSSFRAIPLVEQREAIAHFDTSIVQNAIQPTGELEQFFYARTSEGYLALPFERNNFDEATGQYSYTPTRGPLFGKENSILGRVVILLFAFLMGYGATLAEPALNALGLKVEELSVGTFKKSLLMQSVAIGVGIGLLGGMARLVWNIPLVLMLIPAYLAALILTRLSGEDFVNIGWDSAGVTTGPITVPLVLAMGLGVGNQLGVVEGFGILSMASVCPIISVLLVGLIVTRKRKSAQQETPESAAEGGAT